MGARAASSPARSSSGGLSSRPARARSPGDHVQAVAVLAGQLPQRGRELDALIVGQVAGAVHGDSQLLPDRAVRPVGGDQVRGSDALDGSGPGVRDGGTDTAVILSHPEQLAAEADAGAGQAAQVLEHDGLTLYRLFSSKRSLLQAVLDVSFGGDD
jgi:hypothetical protein